MSASFHSFPKLPRSRDLLGELLHSLSQPLTSLQCSLELSLEHSPDLSPAQVAEHQQESVAVALQQTEKIIAMIRLMREYLDAELLGLKAFSTRLEPMMRIVIEELSSIAAVRGVRLRMTGTSTVMLPVPELQLRLALQYLIAPLIEAQPWGGQVVFLLEEHPAGTVLRGEGGGGFRALDATTTLLRRVRTAIAARVLESVGASLVLGDDDSVGFLLRIPRHN